MNAATRMMIADWHGEQCAAAYARWVHASGMRAKGSVPLASTTADDALRDYVRHAGIAEKMWSTAS